MVRLTPRASSNRIGETLETLDGASVLTVYVTEIPENGKANKALIQLLAREYKIPVSKIQIVRGHKGREKMIRIED
jgi:uncharacterized protein YggU (UPF0235/DUF167 family)